MKGWFTAVASPIDPGSAQQSRWRSRKMRAAALTISAVAGLACLTQTSAASAQIMGGATITVSAADKDNWSAGWSSAYAQCRSSYPTTKSVRLLGTSEHPSDPTKALQLWECHDTPVPIPPSRP
jgi:hypothetical protein